MADRSPVDWQAQAAAVRHVLAVPPLLQPSDLLLPLDLEGRSMRPLHPPPDVRPRFAAVLLLLYPHADELWLPLTVRSSALPSHRGEVALPGGRVDPEDADLAATALREAHEELGIAPASVEIWGELSSFYIPPSNFYLTPIVGFTPAPPAITPNPSEVEAVFHVPLRQLLDPASVAEELWERSGLQLRIPFFALEGYKVWGATAILLSELVARLRRAA